MQPSRFVSTKERAPAEASQGDVVEEALQRVCRNAVGVTGADGAAIALRDGSGWVCRARIGKLAPALGAFLDVHSGISGKCVQTGQALICHDAATDSRVAAEVCNTLGIRSVLAVPFKRDEEVLGVVEVLSDQPYAFGECHVSRLSRLLDSASERLVLVTLSNLRLKLFEHPTSIKDFQTGETTESFLDIARRDTYKTLQRARLIKIVAAVLAIIGIVGIAVLFVSSQ
jgi:GAF domain-containing protein